MADEDDDDGTDDADEDDDDAAPDTDPNIITDDEPVEPPRTSEPEVVDFGDMFADDDAPSGDGAHAEVSAEPPANVPVLPPPDLTFAGEDDAVADNDDAPPRASSVHSAHGLPAAPAPRVEHQPRAFAVRAQPAPERFRTQKAPNQFRTQKASDRFRSR